MEIDALINKVTQKSNRLGFHKITDEWKQTVIYDSFLKYMRGWSPIKQLTMVYFYWLVMLQIIVKFLSDNKLKDKVG